MSSLSCSVMRTLLRTSLVLFLIPACTSSAAPDAYEPTTDPGLGFNLVSWANFGAAGAATWENAVQAVYDAGFDEVSLSPVRFVTLGTGSIATTSSQGPELSHIAAGIARAKSLGMNVTVNPFVEPVNFSMWRGLYDPIPSSGEWTTFWTDYELYLTDVAIVAEANGADSMTVGTELRAITQNAGNNAKWSSVITAVDSNFSGSLGYAANWDNFKNSNLESTIWENPAIDFLGIDAYFTGLLSNGQADASGSYPNATFISQVESAWNNKLDNDILPFAAARKSGVGMPVKFTEVGYLPYNRTSVTPQNSSGTLDADEQNMAFEGLMRALDGRNNEIDATHVWQWSMPGSNGSLWNLDPNGGDQPNNQQTAQWLSNFVSNSADPNIAEPPGVTEVLYSFEDDLEGFQFPGFGGSSSTVARVLGVGNTDGNAAMSITKTDDDWTWDAEVQMTGTQLQAMLDAVADDIGKYELEIDVTYVAADLPAGLTDMDMHISFQSDPNSEWGQAFPFAEISGPVDQTFRVIIPLDSLDNQDTLVPGITGLDFHIGFDGTWPDGNSATVYIDRIALTDITAFPDDADFDANGRVDGQDFLILQSSLGITTGADFYQGDANRDGAVDQQDLAIWEAQYGQTSSAAAAAAVPEPCCLCLALACLLFSRRTTAEMFRMTDR